MTLANLVGVLIGLVNNIIPVLVTIAVAFFIAGGIRFIYKSGDARGHGADKTILAWGLIALFILVSVWGILALLRQYFNL